MRIIILLAGITLFFNLNAFAQDNVHRLNDSASYYYQKKDLRKAFDFYERYFSSPTSSMSNYSAYYAAVASCYVGNMERAKFYLKRSAEIGYDYVGYDAIKNDTLNKCLHQLTEWNEFITNYKTTTEKELSTIKSIEDGLNDTSWRANKSILSETYLKKYSEHNSSKKLIQHIKSFNSFPTPKKTGHWTLYNYRVNDSLSVPFLVRIPKNYNPAKKTDLYVYLHGGIVNKLQFSSPADVMRGLEIKFIDNPAVEDAFIIYPFGKRNFGWLFQQQAFDAIVGEIATVKSLYNINDNRIYIGGHSNGGSGAFWYMINKPSPFAATFGLNYLPKVYSSNTPIRNLNNEVPFLGISGTEDSVFPLSLVNEIYGPAQANGANWRNFTISGEHTATVKNGDSIRYLFQALSDKVRNPFPKKINWETDNVQNGRNLWLEIKELDTLAAKAEWHINLNPALTQNGKTDVVNFNKNKSGGLIANVSGNTISIETSRVKRLQLYISGDMFDLNNPIKVVVNGKEMFNKKVVDDKNEIINEYLKTRDRDFIVSNLIDILVPK